MTTMNLRERLRRIFLWSIAVLIAAAALGYGGDYFALKVREWARGNPYGTVIVNHFYAVAQKNGKTQFIFDPPAPQTCVNSLFPHEGWEPCWYLSKHPDQRTDI